MRDIRVLSVHPACILPTPTTCRPNQRKDACHTQADPNDRFVVTRPRYHSFGGLESFEQLTKPSSIANEPIIRYMSGVCNTSTHDLQIKLIADTTTE